MFPGGSTSPTKVNALRPAKHKYTRTGCKKFANGLLEIIVKMPFSFLGFNYRTNEVFAVKEIMTRVGC